MTPAPPVTPPARRATRRRPAVDSTVAPARQPVRQPVRQTARQPARKPSAASTRRVRALQNERTSKLNLCAAVVMAVLGLAGSQGSFGVEGFVGERGQGFSIGLVTPPPAATVGRPADAATVGAATVEMPAGTPVTAATSPIVVKPMPTGKGMWIYEFPRTEGGKVDAIVAKAKAAGITHVYPRMGSHWDGFNVRSHMDAFLPKAHAAGLLVFGWDFPRLGDSLPSDIERARTMINYTSPSGDRLDGFSADIETINEGSHVSPAVASAYGRALREIAGPDFTLIATVPRPSPRHRPTYPYAEIVESFDAIAPMVYWLNRQPDTDVIGAMDELAKFGKPVFPVGQAYDGKPEGGRPGVPPPEELYRFMQTSLAKGATGVSFWSWQAADAAAWDAISNAAEYRGPGQ
ncbi:MAG TPA: hypothetical protein VM942_00480 [Acidimicrobiales bacterium]|nr:hypothetical protein [Acidimicrobiales bacterium]